VIIVISGYEFANQRVEMRDPVERQKEKKMKNAATSRKQWHLPCFILICMVCSLPAVCFPADEKAKPVQPVKFQQSKEPRTADDLFKEAQTILEKNPGEAARLLKQGLTMKPDAFPARQQLATLYEKQKQWGFAITEYEIVNRAAGTAESFLALANALARAGYTVEAAIKAEEGAVKYPSHGALQLLAGEQLVASGQFKKAVPYLKRAADLTPKIAQIPALLGQIHEKEGKMIDAMKAYRQALALDKNQKDALSGEARLKTRSVARPGFIVVLPDGWLPSERGIWNPSTGQDITMIVSDKALPVDVATRLILERVPKGLYDDAAVEFQKKQIAEIRNHEKNEHSIEVTADQASATLREVIPSMAGLEKENVQGNYQASLVCASYDAGREKKTSPLVFQCVLSLVFGEKTISWVAQGSGPTGEIKGALSRFPEGLIAVPGEVK
jgi:tetratricopeptide (TPR) repeat protein